jgi:enediyne biosynthesis protein E4
LAIVVAGSAHTPDAAAAPSSVTVTLRAKGALSVSQGLPFEFEARASNGDPGPVDAGITFRLTTLDGSIRFSRWIVKIPGSGSAHSALAPVTSQWFSGTGAFRISAEIGGRLAGNILTFQVTPSTAVVPVFRDVTGSSGLTTNLPPASCTRLGSGAAWGDIDGDTDLDLYVPHQDASAELWVNDGTGHFTEQAAGRGASNPSRIGMGAVFADYDNDGDQDLYVVNDGSNRLYRNGGTGHFIDVSSAAGVDDAGSGPSASWGDYDNDGYLDLYVVNNRNCSAPIQADKLYRNQGDGTFTDQTALLEREGSTFGAGFAASWVDIDGDGDQDLYLVEDDVREVNAQPNYLWRNDGPDPDLEWRFTNISAESKANYAMNAMGTAVGDFDRDLDLDFAISNVKPTVLARNNGDGTFTDVAAAVRVDRPDQRAGVDSVTWGLEFVDLNLDGWQDLYVAAGPLDRGEAQPNAVFVSDRDGAFLDLSALTGAADPGASRGLALADYDRDGREDLFVVNQDGRPHLYRNETPFSGFHWLEVDTVGVASNRDGCGARLILMMGSVKLLREVLCGSTSLASGSDPTVHFGLGSASWIDSLEILWPSGKDQVLTGLPMDRVMTVTEPATE